MTRSRYGTLPARRLGGAHRTTSRSSRKRREPTRAGSRPGVRPRPARHAGTACRPCSPPASAAFIRPLRPAVSAWRFGMSAARGRSLANGASTLAGRRSPGAAPLSARVGHRSGFSPAAARQRCRRAVGPMPTRILHRCVLQRRTLPRPRRASSHRQRTVAGPRLLHAFVMRPLRHWPAAPRAGPRTSTGRVLARP